MRVLLLFVQLLLLFSLSVAAAAPNKLHPWCQGKCDRVSIPYPFGIGTGCFLPGFELHCNMTDHGHLRPFFRNVEIIDISLQNGQARMYNNISSSCYDSKKTTNVDEPLLDFKGTPYVLSNTLNSFTTVGCWTLAYFISNKRYLSGCRPACPKESDMTNWTCSGKNGCCQTSIPKRRTNYMVQFKYPDYNNCSYAFLVEEKSFNFERSYVNTATLLHKNRARVPLVVDWVVGNQTCEVARNMTSYACVSHNSECVYSNNSRGYFCNCSSGYQGNPYLRNGCQDIDECNLSKVYPCNATCENFAGGYNCTCPSGNGNPYVKGGCRCAPDTKGDAYKEGGCKPKIFPLWLGFFIGGLCILVGTIFTYIASEKVKLIRTKRKCFRLNGGLLLQEQINAHQGVTFKIFKEEQIVRATNCYNKNQVLGEGGHGVVYKGTLDDKRIVAIKKSKVTNENQKKNFAKEMYIVSLINHKNVVKILGCCLEVEVPILVYEFIPKGSLFQYIQDKNYRMPLDFRLKVAIESATALSYLHSDASPSILHGDVKSNNILLDDNNTPKISDFGTSFLTRIDKSLKGTYLQGTDIYMDPEYRETLELTQKSDVYSFAVVLLELLTRREVLPSNGSRKNISLLSDFYSSVVKENGLLDILDDEVKCEIGMEQLGDITELLKQCLSSRGDDRPTMKEVAAWLERLRIFNRLTWQKHNPEERENLLDESSRYHITDSSASFSLENQMVHNIGSGR